MMRATLFTFLLCCIGGYALASDRQQEEIKTLSLKSDFGTNKDWHVTAWQSKDKDSAIGDVPSKLCFWIESGKKEEHCTPITSTLPNGGITYNYQTVVALEKVHADAKNPSAVLLKLDARFFGGGSGKLEQISFWKYEPEIDMFEPNLLMTLTDQGEYHIFNQGLLVTADAINALDETHFAPHHFYIEVYRYEPKTGYMKALGYRTSSKYPGFDKVEKIDVISHETAKIKNLLKEIDAK